MYKWYSNAEACYAFLEDLETVQTSDSFLSDLGKCRWFTRGWTLQELIAPRQITFFNKNRVEVGDKESLSGVITEITRVDGLVPRKGATIQQLSIANRMSWLHVGKQLARGRSILPPWDIWHQHALALWRGGRKGFSSVAGRSSSENRRSVYICVVTRRAVWWKSH
jgi:hypothetical protein